MLLIKRYAAIEWQKRAALMHLQKKLFNSRTGVEWAQQHRSNQTFSGSNKIAICFVSAAASQFSDSQYLAAKQYTTKANNDNDDNKKTKMENKSEKVSINKEELKKRLTPLQYQVTQEAATERPFSGCYNKHYEKGVYQCIVCHQDLFSSDTKYDSGCGWPAFNDVLDKGKVTLHRDASIPGGNILLLIKNPDLIRTEVRCAKCNAHMGHVFEDGPKPTRKRYCINSAAIAFIAADKPAMASVAAPIAAATGTPIAQQ